MNFFIFSALLNAFVSGLLGVVVYFKNRKETINKIFFLLSLSVVFWSLSYWQWMNSMNLGNSDLSLFWARMLSICSLFIPVFYFHWVLTFLGINKKRKAIITLSYLIVFIILIFSFSSLFIEGVGQRLHFEFWPVPGILYSIYLLVIYVGLIFYSLFLLLKHYRIESGIKKSSIKYIIIGSLLGFIGGATNFFLWYNIPIPPYGNILVFSYPLVLAIASFRYHLFNIKVIATELFIFSAWIFALARAIISESNKDALINFAWFLVLVVLGMFIIRSVLKEVRIREEMERLAGELEKANAKLKELDKAKSDFVTITSHQLRTPLTAIKGYASMLLENSFGQIPERAQLAIDRIFQSSNRLVFLINDFLNLSRIERGKMEYHFEKTSLKELIEGIFDEFKTINAKKKEPLELSLVIEKKNDFIVNIDSEKIRQVIYNLIDNALKYTQKGFVKIVLHKNPEKQKIEFCVKDSGIGMSKKSLDQIFDKFSRAQNGSSVHVDGTGLGLFVAREITKAHGGDVGARSDGEGKGSEFYMELPVKEV